jgi:hypothetical protein
MCLYSKRWPSELRARDWRAAVGSSWDRDFSGWSCRVQVGDRDRKYVDVIESDQPSYSEKKTPHEPNHTSPHCTHLPSKTDDQPDILLPPQNLFDLHGRSPYRVFLQEVYLMDELDSGVVQYFREC